MPVSPRSRDSAATPRMAEEEGGLAAFEALRESVARGDAAAVSAVLAAHPSLDVNRRDVFQSCVIHSAAAGGHSRIVQALLDRGADVQAVDYGNLRKTALHFAALHGHVAVIEVIMSHIE